MKRGTSIAFALAMLVLSVGCSDTSASPAPCYEAGEQAPAPTCDGLGQDCASKPVQAPALGMPQNVVPDGPGVPDGVRSQIAHNNLDIAWHQGRLFFAFRTAPFHFADEDVQLYVMSTADQKMWQLEAAFDMGKDLREPRFLTLGDRLFLYFARLSEVTFSFLPEAIHVSEQVAGCDWTEPAEIRPLDADGFIPWRMREVQGVGQMMGYVGGQAIYEQQEGGVQVHWLQTTDGLHFEAVVGDDSEVLRGGSSETDWVILDDGRLLAVSRNESGDEMGFGSKICTAPADDLGNWTCSADRKKYDSPLMFTHEGQAYLIGRRQVANDGDYDLGHEDKPLEEQAQAYQLAYWSTPKRCSLWRVDPDARSVDFVTDLPSNGDTCFASSIQLSAKDYLVYNYTSPLDDPNLSWQDGQFAETSIYRVTLTMP